MPENYDHAYRGPMTLRDALAQSINIPAVKLLYLVGVDDALNFAKRLGISTLLNKNRYGLTLVLGGGEVSLLEMTSVYGVFANDGSRVPYQSILKVTNADGTTLEEYKPVGEQVIDQEIARKISDILSDNQARTPAYGPQSFLYFGDHQVAVKTGTTNDYRDTWIIGYTPSIVVGAWAGNNNNSPMEKKVAGFIIAPLWNAFMKEVFHKIPSEDFMKPLPNSPSLKPALRGIWYGNTTYEIDKFSGKLATINTPVEAKEVRVVPDPHEILHWVDKENPLGPIPTVPQKDQQYWLWETPVQMWIKTNGLPTNTITTIPQEYDNIHTADQSPVIRIITPSGTSSCVLSEKLLINAEVLGRHGIKSVDLFFNNSFISSVLTPPYLFAFVPNENFGSNGENTLRLVAHDLVENKTELEQKIICSEVGNMPILNN
jgi:membrane peptidoglycan carboxypeptidase